MDQIPMCALCIHWNGDVHDGPYGVCENPYFIDLHEDGMTPNMRGIDIITGRYFNCMMWEPLGDNEE